MANAMETAVYLATAGVTILWSVWIYRLWSHRARLRESDAGRFYHIIAPSGYFVVLALAGWQRAQVIRLDLIGIVGYDAIIVLCALVLMVTGALRQIDYRRAFRRLLAVYNVLTIVLIVSLYLVRFFPPLLMRFTALYRQLIDLQLFRFAWIGLNPETHEQDLVSMANKVLIALLSYIPVSLARALYISRQMSRQRRETYDQLAALRGRIEVLERKLSVEKRPAAPAAEALREDRQGAGQAQASRDGLPRGEVATAGEVPAARQAPAPREVPPTHGELGGQLTPEPGAEPR